MGRTISSLFFKLQENQKSLRELIADKRELIADKRDAAHLQDIYDLSLMDRILRNAASGAETGSDASNVFYRLLTKIYVEGYTLKSKKMPPPLAVIHPYHSKRIQAQKGAFTIFPFPSETVEDAEKFKKANCMILILASGHIWRGSQSINLLISAGNLLRSGFLSVGCILRRLSLAVRLNPINNVSHWTIDARYISARH